MIQFDAGNEGRFLRPIQSLKFVSVNFKFRKSNMKLCMKTLLAGLIPYTDYTDYSNILYNYLYVCIWYDTTSINIDLLCQRDLKNSDIRYHRYHSMFSQFHLEAPFRRVV